MKKFILILCLFLSYVSMNAQDELKTIYVGEHSTTHILFTTDLTYVDISSPDVLAAKIVDASKNMLALKARKKFDFITTISALEANGTMHTFKISYDSFPENLVIDTRTVVKPSSSNKTEEKSNKINTVQTSSNTPNNSIIITSDETSNFGRKDAPTIEEVTKLKQQIFHIGDRNFNIEVYCTNIFVYSDMTYIVLTVYNNTDIGFEAGEAQFTIENLNRKSKDLATDKSIWAKSSYGSLSCPPRGRSVVGYTIPKMTLLKNECMKIYIYEKSGKRNLILTLTDKDINYAVSPKSN